MKPVFLFVHGFGCDRETWRLQVEGLSPEYDVVTLDLPGHGAAPLPAVQDLASLAEAVAETKDGCARPVVIVGHSMGCRVALETFRVAATGIAGLVFLDGSATRREHSTRLLALMRERLRLHGMRASLRANFEEMFVPSSPVGLRESVVATALRLDPVFAENILVELAQWDAADALKPVADAKLPVLSIQSTALGPDMKRRSLQLGQTSAWGEMVDGIVPGARSANLPGLGHFVHLEAPDVVNEELDAFARRCSLV